MDDYSAMMSRAVRPDVYMAAVGLLCAASVGSGASRLR